MATSIRLTPQLERLVTRGARRRKQTKSEVIRSVLSALAQEEKSQVPAATPYEAMKHLIGCASGGPPDLSQKTGAKLRVMLSRKQSAR